MTKPKPSQTSTQKAEIPPQLSRSPARKRTPRKPALPRISSYAEALLDRQSSTANPKSQLTNAEPSCAWISTTDAARLSGYSIRQIQNLCEQGYFIEGEEWKQRPARHGVSRGGRIFIHPAAMKKLNGNF